MTDKAKKILFIIISAILLIALVYAGIVIYQQKQHEAELIQTFLTVDSLRVVNSSIAVENATLKADIRNLMLDKAELESKLGNIQPVYIKTLKEYNSATPEKKADLRKAEYEKRLKQREGK